MINFEDFEKVELRIGKILVAEPVEGSEKLLKLSVDFGKDSPRQVISGIAKWYKPEKLINKSFVFVTNLEPRKIMGLESQAMILAAGEPARNASASVAGGKNLALISPNKKVEPGSKIG